MRRIGVLSANAESDPHQQHRLTVFRQGLAKLGWVEDRNVRIDFRYAAEDIKLMGTLATELVGLRPDVLFAGSTPGVTALRQATRSIPIVFAGLNDPIGAGFVKSLARPGGNITGFILTEPALASKWVELLKDMTPSLQRAVFLFNPETAPRAAEYLHYAESAAARLKVEMITAAVHDERGVEDAFVTLAHIGDGGLVVFGDTFNRLHRHQIIVLAARYRLPVIYPYRFYAEDGGLISYGTDSIDLIRQTATYVDRILRGEKPSDLPVQAPKSFEMVINLGTARALGLTIPETLLATAYEVIQ
jgi:putative ABC transport system substrate-binding protein